MPKNYGPCDCEDCQYWRYEEKSYARGVCTYHPTDCIMEHTGEEE